MHWNSSQRQILKLIDNSDRAILNSTIRPYMFKTISAKSNRRDNDFTLSFASPIFEAGTSEDQPANLPLPLPILEPLTLRLIGMCGNKLNQLIRSVRSDRREDFFRKSLYLNI